ncbi:MAG: sigma-70 family RNA polymerase sigma factor [Anaerolineaceae bacterium]|jgi:RNA polymerase sigma-70 factor (ECF subfamily)|nr:sigma-70 family RNA polymerase sigma factor [Anaerolineaceae bacterium]
MDEQALIKDARKGDLNAFNGLVLHYQDMAFNVAYRIMGEQGAAGDATQDAFISAYQKLEQYRGGSFKAWLLRIVSNCCYDELRRRKRQPVTPLKPELDDGDLLEEPAWLEDDSATPEEQSEQAELQEAIQHCIGELDEKFKTVLVLIDVEGLDYETASEAAGAPLGTVKSRLARARERVQDCLQGFWELLPDLFRLNDEEKA